MTLARRSLSCTTTTLGTRTKRDPPHQLLAVEEAAQLVAAAAAAGLSRETTPQGAQSLCRLLATRATHAPNMAAEGGKPECFLPQASPRACAT